MSRLSFPANHLWSNSAPLCPCCEHPNEVDGYRVQAQELFRQDCQNCGRDFWIEPRIKVAFSTVGDCMKHQLKLELHLDNGVTKYVCKKCKGYIYNWQLPGGKFPKITEEEFEFVEEVNDEI